MDTLIGLTSRDYALLTTDTAKLQSIVVLSENERKMFNISKKFAMAISGKAGDCVKFPEFIQKNVSLYRIRNGYELPATEIANLTRQTLAEYLRTREPYLVNTLMAGYDDTKGAVLFYMDNLGSLIKMPFAVYGFGGYFALSIMDRYHHANLSVDEGYGVLKKCVAEIQKRMVLFQPNFCVKFVDKNGVKDFPPITAKNILNEV